MHLLNNIYIYIYIYIKNKTGPRIVPWSTPSFILAMSENTSLYNTI